MAERKTKYTNADLKAQGGPATEYGPWTQTEAGRRRYEEIISPSPSAVDLLNDAKTSLRNAQPMQALLNDVSRQHYDIPAEAAQRDAANMPKQFLRGVRESPVSQGALVAGSVLPTPAAPIFGGLMSVQSLLDTIENPSLLNAGMTALGVVPGVKALNKLGKSRAAAKEGRDVAEKLYRGTGMSRGSEVPYRAGGSVGPFPPRPTGGPRPTPPRPTGGFQRPELNMEGLPGPPASFTPQPYNDPRRQNVRSVIDSLVAGDTAAPKRAGASMASLMDDVPEMQVVDDIPEVFSSVDEATGYAGRNRPQASEPEDLTDILDTIAGKRTRYPMGATGDEYAGIRETGGAFKQPNLTPEEAALIEEFWTDIALGRR